MGGFIQIAREKLGLTSDTIRPGIHDAIELVLDNSCPKIRLIRGHKKKLIKPVESALNFITKIIDAIPGPLEVLSDEAVDDVLVKPFFLGKDQLKETLVNDFDLRDLLPRVSGNDFFVLLTMNREVKTIFGSRQQGEIIVKDVVLKAINFSDHKFRVPSSSMAELKHAIQRGILQILSHWALENVLEEQSRKEEFSQLKEEMTAKVKILAHERQQMVLKWRADSAGQSYHAAQNLLERIEDELNAIKTKSLDTDYHLEEVTRILSHPSDFLTAEHASMYFDRMGILLDGRETGEKDDVHVLEIKLGDTLRRSCVILKCSRNTLFNKRA